MKITSSALKSRVGLKRAVVVPLDALAQVEGVVRAVGRDVPALGQAGHDLGAAALELDDAVVDRLVGVEGGAGGVDARDRSSRDCPRSRTPASWRRRRRRRPGPARRSQKWLRCRGQSHERILREHVRSAPSQDEEALSARWDCGKTRLAGIVSAKWQATMRPSSRRGSGRSAAAALHRIGAAAWRTRSPLGGVQRRGQLALEHDALRCARRRPGVEASSACVYGCSGRAKMLRLGALLHHVAQVHHQHLVRDVAHHRQVVRDEQIGQLEFAPAGRPAGSAPGPGSRRRAPTPARRPPAAWG